MKPLPGHMVIRALASPWVSINHGHHATRSQHTVCLLQELARGHRWQLMQQIRAMVIRALASPWVSINHGHHATRSQHTVCLLQELARGHRWQLMQQIRACHEVEAAVLHRQ